MTYLEVLEGSIWKRVCTFLWGSGSSHVLLLLLPIHILTFTHSASMAAPASAARSSCHTNFLKAAAFEVPVTCSSPCPQQHSMLLADTPDAPKSAL